MTISVNGAVPRKDLKFSQKFLQQIVPHTFLHQSLGRRNFILQLSGKIKMFLNLTRQRRERELCAMLCRCARKGENFTYNNLSARGLNSTNSRICGRNCHKWIAGKRGFPDYWEQLMSLISFR